MKKLLVPILLLSSSSIAAPAWAQTKLTAKPTGGRADNCTPIGRTANGELVYSMKCDNIPAPPAPPPQAEAKQAPPPEREERGTGFFGMSFDRRQDQ
ncbi:hypothetical protein [Bradyrhizobium sp. STM 3562]|uniref:hypothetical protein n=1 Tax=Bradyrhizobium sp. STM 3562 TaxID=578924 RepID=UPI00388F17A4